MLVDRPIVAASVVKKVKGRDPSLDKCGCRTYMAAQFALNHKEPCLAQRTE